MKIRPPKRWIFKLESKDNDNSGAFAEYLCTNINSAFKLLFFLRLFKESKYYTFT